MNAEVESIKVEIDKPFKLELKNGKKLTPDFICIACGGFPKKQQFEWLLNLGHTIENPVPSLFTFNIPGNKIVDLMGITVQEVRVKVNNTKLEQRGPLLITHWGFSGPSILKLSAWGARLLEDMKYEFLITVNWLPDYNENSLREKFQLLRFDIATQKIVNRNPFGLPARLWEYLLQEAGINHEIRWADLPAKEQNKFIKLLTGQGFKIKGKTTFKEEFVTAGGISLNEVDPNTMQSKIVKGLYFAGEILDIDGVTGGFNFQNAWTTGYISSKLL
jgi:predicted Rossmann fold flavoprotein